MDVGHSRNPKQARSHLYRLLGHNPDDSYISEDSNPNEELQKESKDSEENSNDEKKVIRITRGFRTKWDLLMMAFALYTCFSVPFFIAFHSENSIEFFFLNTFVDILFLTDIYLNFYTSFIDDKGEEILKLKKIRRNYLRGRFWLDLVASIPLDNFILQFSDPGDSSGVLQVTDLLKMLRILRLGRIIRFTRMGDSVKAVMKLLQLTLYLIIWVHLTGCLWFMVVRGAEEWVPVPDFLTGTTTLYEDGIWRQYFTSFYHAVWLLGGGEVAPRNSFEAFLASGLIIIGALITAVLFGEMAGLMANLNKKTTVFQEIVDGAMTTMKNLKLDPKLFNEILDYITATVSSQSVQDEYEQFTMFISPSLQQKVSACIYEPIISKNIVLKDDKRIQDAVMHKLYNRFTTPETLIITTGDESHSMYFLVSGAVNVYVPFRDNSHEPLCILFPGAHFGEIGLVYKTLRTATVEGQKYCNIAELQEEDYDLLVSTYPYLEKQLKNSAQVYEDDWKKFLVDALSLAEYFERLPKETFNELPYHLKQVKVEHGEYLFTPGQTVENLYVLYSGRMEVSISINDRYLHTLKKKRKYKDIEDSPVVPRRRDAIIDEAKYKLEIASFKALKRKAQIVPYMDHKGIVGFTFYGEDPPENYDAIGEYPQEIILTELSQGAVLNRKLVLNKETYQTQCKALEPCVLYALNYKVIEGLIKEHNEFKTELNIIRSRMRSLDHPLATDHLDYISSDTPAYGYDVKSKIVSTLLHLREKRRKSGSQIARMVPKLQAVLACKKAGDFTLLCKVMSGEVPPHHITPEGHISDAVLPAEDNLPLPSMHPIVKTFNDLFNSLTSTEGSVYSKYYQLKDSIHNECARLDELKSVLSALKEKVTSLSPVQPQLQEAPEHAKRRSDTNLFTMLKRREQ